MKTNYAEYRIRAEIISDLIKNLLIQLLPLSAAKQFSLAHISSIAPIGKEVSTSIKCAICRMAASQLNL